MDQTPRLALPFILPGQAQKELCHNEALQRLDMVVQPIVEPGQADQPPPDPELGQSFIVGANPVQGWTGQAGAIASWTEGGWRFIAAFEGLEVSIRGNGLKMRFIAGAWETGQLRAASVMVNGQRVLAQRQPAITAPSGGPVVDQEARAVIGNILTALRQHGLLHGG